MRILARKTLSSVLASTVLPHVMRSPLGRSTGTSAAETLLRGSFSGGWALSPFTQPFAARSTDAESCRGATLDMELATLRVVP